MGVMIGWKALASSIDFCCSTCCSEPCNKMLDDPLVELVKNVWGDRMIDMSKGKIFSEWVDHWLDA